MFKTLACLLLSFFALAARCDGPPYVGGATELAYFPFKDDHQPSQFVSGYSQTGWQVTWHETNPHPDPQNPVPCNTICIADVKFAPDLLHFPNQWITVLDDARLSDIIADYDGDGPFFNDITSEQGLMDITTGSLGPACAAPGHISAPTLPGGSQTPPGVRVEYRDDGIRWAVDANQTDPLKVYRGAQMVIWAIYKIANYNYIIEFGFRDDGVISFRVGATGQNYYPKGQASSSHVHVALWRIQPNLAISGTPQITANILTRQIMPDCRSQRVIGDMLCKREGGFVFKPEEFPSLRLTGNQKAGNNADLIAYDLIPSRLGNWRDLDYAEGGEYSASDLWITRLYPDVSRFGQQSGSYDPSKPSFEDVPAYIAGQPEDITGQQLVLWYASCAYHDPRDEDFDSNGQPAATMTIWSGFELKPFGVFSQSPLYP